MDFWFGKTQGIFKHSFKYRIFKHLFEAASGLSLLIITFNLKLLKKALKKKMIFFFLIVALPIFSVGLDKKKPS